MSYWNVDANAYKATYSAAIEGAPTHLSTKLLDIISRPQAISLHSSYHESKVKLLVLGQETFGNYAPLAGQKSFQAWAHSVGEYIAFNYAREPGDPAGSDFWKAFETFSRRVGRADRRSIAWSNLSKCQLVEPRSDNRVSLNLGGDDLETYARWLSPLFRAEMDFVAPHGVLAFIGRENWFEQLLYKFYPNAHSDWFDSDGYRVWSCGEMPFCLVSTVHPSGWAAHVKPAVAAENATNALMRCLQERGHETLISARP